MLKGVSILDLDPKDLLSMMRADPEQTGRLAIATTLAAHGESDLALSTLEKLGFDSLGDEGRLLGARLYVDKREGGRALDLLAPLGRGIYAYPRGAELYGRRSARRGSARPLESVHDRSRASRVDECSAGDGLAPYDGAAARVGAPPRLRHQARAATEKPRVLAMVDRMLARGAGAAAEPLLQALDAVKATRGAGRPVAPRGQRTLARGQGRGTQRAAARSSVRHARRLRVLEPPAHRGRRALRRLTRRGFEPVGDGLPR